MAKGLDLSQYKIKLNIASARLFEQFTGKSFFEMGEEDSLQLAYCLLIANNEDLGFTYETFLTLLSDKKISNWLLREMDRITKFHEQLKFVKKSKLVKKAKEGTNDVEALGTVGDYASALIINYGMDPHYVNYEMALYEMEDYFYTAEMKRRAQLEEKRLFTSLYFLVLFYLIIY